MYDLKIIVDEIKGFCDLPMQIGDYFEVKGGKLIIPEDKHICIWALQSILPFISAKQRKINEENDWLPETKRICCPDPNGMVIYRIERIDPETKLSVDNIARTNHEPHSRILVSEENCTGCRACETACSFIHSGNFNGLQSRIKIEKDEPAGQDIPHICRQCGHASCVAVCPVDALERNPETKAVILNQDKCLGCRQCVQACPFSAINFDEKLNIPLICDLCQGDPDCVKRCPVGAVKYGNAGNN